MSHPRILVIGENSFIGKEFLSQFPVTAISHKDSNLRKQISLHDIIINFSLDPALRSGDYDENKDFDTYLAHLISSSSQRLVILSTRAVYGSYIGEAFKEDTPPRPETHYAKNKVVIERSCQDILGEHTLILRLSNVFGYEWPAPPGRKTFMSQLLASLKDTGRMTFDISPDSEKDFLPVETCCRLIHDLSVKAPSGIYNIASGQSLDSKSIANAIGSGYGKYNTVFSSARIDSFYMDVSKLRNCGLELPKPAEILARFQEIGTQLAKAQGNL